MYRRMMQLTWPEAEELGREGAVGLIPTGSVEQHGPQLPLGTDTFIADELGRRVGEALTEPVVVAPCVPGGLSSHHLAFPGTVTFDADVFGGCIDAYVQAFERMGVDRVAIFSGHGGNLDFLGRYEDLHRKSGATVRLIAHHDLRGYVEAMFAGARAGGFEPAPTDIHAGGVETSQGLALFPELVRPFGDVIGYTANEDGWLDRMLRDGMKAVSPTGVLGDVRSSDAVAGEQVFAAITDYLVGWIVEGLGCAPVDSELASSAGSS